jgi:uncharacterized membrane protein
MPSDPDRERFEALTETNVRLLRRVADLERRVASVERALNVQHREPVPSEVQAEESLQPPVPPPLPVEPPQTPPEALTLPPPVVTQPQAVETRIGLTWLNRVAVVTCILAVAFFFKYAVDNEWIGPGGRVMLGVIAGLGCLGIADALWRRGHQVYGQGVCGLGIAILYLAFQASFSLYKLVPQSVAFGLMVVVTVAACAMSLRYGSQAIAALGLLGGYATPVLLSTGEKRIWFLLTYTLALDLAAFALARRRSWRGLEPLALISTIVLYVGGISPLVNDERRTPAGLFAFAYWALFVFASRQWPVVYVAHFLAGLAIVEVWGQIPGGYLPAILALTGGLLAVGDRRNWEAAPSVAFTTFWASYAIWRASLHNDPLADSAEALFLTLGFLLFLAWLPWRMLPRGLMATKRDLVLAAANASFFAGRLYYVLEDDYADWRGLAAVAVAAVHLAVGKFVWERQPPERRDIRPVLLLVGVALSLLTLAVPIQFAAFRITIAWALEGAALAWIASRTASKAMTAGSLVVLFITLARLISEDAGMFSAPTDYAAWFNVRFLTFAVAAGSFLISARWLHRAWSSLPPMPVAVYVTGHLVMLWGLGLEVLGWASRTAAPENLRNVQSAAISILIAGYAVALAAAGIATRTRLNRILGLTLIGFVVVKLYLYDVWELRLIYRVLAFAGLGGLLLVMSFLYSRYRSSIESWLQDENPPTT